METAAGALPAAQSRVLFPPCLRMVKSTRNKSSCHLHQPVLLWRARAKEMEHSCFQAGLRSSGDSSLFLTTV